jgi:tRNA(fMet)-specific endonuclease VapC
VAALIDTSVLVAAERGKLDLEAWLRTRPDEAMAISAVTWSELWLGWHRATDPHRRLREPWLRAVGEMFAVVPFDAVAAEVHAGVWAKLAKAGKVIGAHDLIIAATALSRTMAVVTLNAKEFSRVDGLSVIDPS